MKKGVFKEIIIVLLMILAIILVLGVLLYGYVPANRILPEELSYVTPQSVKEELMTVKDIDKEDVILTYELDETDLYNYQRINEYKPGKSNPFSTYVKQDVDNNTQGGENTDKSGSSQDGSSSQSKSEDSSKNKEVTPDTVNPGDYTNKKGLK